MNERIKELFNVAKEYTESQDTGNISQVKLNNICAEKFAELIVRECAEFTHPVTRKFIFEHFGVEELKGWVCPKCGVDRTKAVCPKGHTASLTGDCPMTAEAQ